MSLEQLERGIIKNAEKEADRIVAEAEREAQDLVKEARNRAGKAKKGVQKQTKQQLSHYQDLKKTKQKMRQKQALLTEQKHLIDDVYQRFLTKLERNKKSIMKRLYAQARKGMKPARVYVAAADVSVARTLFRGVKVETQELKGGFILESRDGSQLVDHSYDTIIDTIRGKTLKQVSDALFGGRS